MSRRRRVPKLQRHKASGRAVVRLDGKDHYLGKYGTPDAEAAYHRLISEWLASGSSASGPGGRVDTIAELVSAYLEHAWEYYNGSDEFLSVRSACHYLLALYVDARVDDFGPLALKAVRRHMVEAGLARRTVNRRTGQIKRVFRWGSENELISPEIWHRLQVVEGLRQGQGGKELPKRRPVAWADVEAVRPHVSAQVWAMIRLQWHTGMRPGEVVQMRTCDIDRSGSVWLYRPESHKTDYLGHQRCIALGPRAQDAIAPWLRPDHEAYLFQPREAEEKRRASLIEERQARCGVGNHKRPACRPKRRPGQRYTVDSYRRAIYRACEKTGIDRWTPHQLRHAFKMRAARAGGLEAARAALGHSSVAITEHYGELDMELASIVAKEIG